MPKQIRLREVIDIPWQNLWARKIKKKRIRNFVRKNFPGSLLEKDDKAIQFLLDLGYNTVSNSADTNRKFLNFLAVHHRISKRFSLHLRASTNSTFAHPAGKCYRHATLALCGPSSSRRRNNHHGRRFENSTREQNDGKAFGMESCKLRKRWRYRKLNK